MRGKSGRAIHSPVVALGSGLLVLISAPLVARLFSNCTFPGEGQRNAPHTRALLNVIAIDCAVEEYASRNGGKYPDSLEVLVTPDVDGRTYLDTTRVPKDPWGHEYVYEPPGPGQPRPLVRSYGRDGQPGGEGDDADIDNISIRREASGSNTEH